MAVFRQPPDSEHPPLPPYLHVSSNLLPCPLSFCSLQGYFHPRVLLPIPVLCRAFLRRLSEVYSGLTSNRSIVRTSVSGGFRVSTKTKLQGVQKVSPATTTSSVSPEQHRQCEMWMKPLSHASSGPRGTYLSTTAQETPLAGLLQCLIMIFSINIPDICGACPFSDGGSNPCGCPPSSEVRHACWFLSCKQQPPAPCVPSAKPPWPSSSTEGGLHSSCPTFPLARGWPWCWGGPHQGRRGCCLHVLPSQPAADGTAGLGVSSCLLRGWRNDLWIMNLFKNSCFPYPSAE